MARVKLSEYAAKKVLIGEAYLGQTVTTIDGVARIAGEQLVVKVDVGIKKRNQKGLVLVGVSQAEAIKKTGEYLKQNYARVLVEPLVPHEEADEQYLSVALVRDGFLIMYTEAGGVAVESGEDIKRFVVPIDADETTLATVLETVPKLAVTLINTIIAAMRQYHFVFVEINPFIAQGDTVQLLDAAVELDSAYENLLPMWMQEHIQAQTSTIKTPQETAVQKLDAVSPATFSLTVFSTDAPIYTLLSGGGASLVMLDSLVGQGLQSEVGNYGEYSGAPNKEETAIYTSNVIDLLLKSSAPKKVLIIAGGVANFTDVKTTFGGIIAALHEQATALREQAVLVLVRRGGPRQAEGLALLRDFLSNAQIAHEVFGPEEPLPSLAVKAKAYIHD